MPGGRQQHKSKLLLYDSLYGYDGYNAVSRTT